MNEEKHTWTKPELKLLDEPAEGDHKMDNIVEGIEENEFVGVS